ncbi:MAG TPA: LPXTG cell wall anchor domain-containing protein [Rubrobacter sp.]|nr:LPXTG cell wall anchor domain-containing protein [Rubrobacter sp.]
MLAVLLVSSLVLASAPAVAFAQDATAVDDKVAKGSDVQYVDCSQVAAAFQNQYGGATAKGEGAAAEVANEQGITVNQVNACLGDVGQNPDNNGEDKNTKGDDDKGVPDDVKADTIPASELPDTGGPSLFVVAAGAALLVAGASLMRFRR